MSSNYNPFLGKPKEDTTGDDNSNSQQALDLARAKLSSLYGDPAPNDNQGSVGSQTQPHAPTTAQDEEFQAFTIPRHNKTTESDYKPQTLYVRERNMQQIFYPEAPTRPATPDHELSAPHGDHLLSPPSHQTSDVKTSPSSYKFAPRTPPAAPDKRQVSSRVERDAAISNFKQPEKTWLEKIQFWKNSRPSSRTPTASPAKPKRGPFFKTALVTAFVLALYNQQVISGQINYYISPGDAVVSPQIIDPAMSHDVPEEPLVIIPKINVKVPTVYGVETRDDSVIQEALEKGVVHYARTALPGQVGNTVVLGHSSNSFWNGGQHKNAFSLLDRLDVGDTYMIHYKGKRYVYEIFNKEVVEPTDFSVVSQDTNGRPISTLITCTPPGTSWKRLIIQAEQISPDPAAAEKVTISADPADDEIIAGNTDSLWDNIRQWLFE